MAVSAPAMHGDDLFHRVLSAQRKGVQQCVQCPIGQVPTHHQTESCRAFGHGGGADGNAQQPFGFEGLLAVEGCLVWTDYQGQNRTVPTWTRPTSGSESGAPVLARCDELCRPMGMALHQR